MDSFEYYKQAKERNRLWFVLLFFFCTISGTLGYGLGSHLSKDEHYAQLSEVRQDRRDIITSSVYGDIITAKLHHDDKHKTALEFVEFNLASNVESFTQHGSKLNRLNHEESEALEAVHRYWKNVCYKRCLDRIEYILEKVDKHKKEQQVASKSDVKSENEI
ncbi:hypothetical protein JQC92_21175 [Shewanella sp. 202IG2-18]|uniref:hypothetical protein n=1 Tax=Parashewanella hymeniacidonis TaxID=2807618 RepID=UPI00195F45CA|nr:hypothetical protein [Parashewanella hymeniacidonis]MBM7074498.1 hypothetical protein [Parashewanella hymeniacidonis]